MRPSGLAMPTGSIDIADTGFAIASTATNDQRNPDNTKPNQMGTVKWLFIQENTDQELHGRCDILQETDNRKWDLSGSRGEHQKWDRRHHARTDQEEIDLRTLMGKCACTAEGYKSEIEQRNWEHDSCFEGQPVE